jgi:hypothetical protein|tara:strand:+ start:1715 stop:1999 length:285 start_codon:yes stop_codon:yes gene_type:complete
MNIAETIRDQIKALDFWAFGAWGAKDFVKTSTEGLRFKTSGMVKWKGYVSIELNGHDLYDVKFQRVRKMNVVTDKELDNVFADQLVEIINAQVG